MQSLDAVEIRERTPWGPLIAAIADEFRSDRSIAPERHAHALPQRDGSTGSLLLMPSWSGEDLIVVKVVTYFPANANSDVSTVNSVVLLFDGGDGRALATLDGDELTTRRTAATSALAARYLARTDASRLLVVGTGRLAADMALAHCHARPIETVEIWGRNPERAVALVARLRDLGLRAEPSTDLAASVEAADIVSCATGATAPLIAGDWLAPGTHLDLVGGFRPDMREADDAAVTKATVFVDTMAGAVRAGDLAQPLADGVMTEVDVADLRAVVVGERQGRVDEGQITLFKSAGSGLADLAAARLVWRSASSSARA